MFNGLWNRVRAKHASEFMGTPLKAQLPPDTVRKPTFLDYRQASEKLGMICSALEGEISKRETLLERYALITLHTVCLVARHALNEVNDEYINVPVCWSDFTGFPRAPTLVADAKNYVTRHALKNSSAALIHACSGWVCFLEEKMICCCGKNGQRSVNLKIMLHNRLAETSGSILELQQLVGVKSDDVAHLAYHYGKGGMSEKEDKLRIIGISVSAFKMEESLYFCAKWQKEWDDHLNLEEFVRRVEAAAKEAVPKGDQ